MYQMILVKKLKHRKKLWQCINNKAGCIHVDGEIKMKNKKTHTEKKSEKDVALKNRVEEFKDKKYYLTDAQGKYLTKREAECVYYLAKGYTIKEIGKALNISPRTVEDNLRRIKDKLAVRSRAGLISKLIECQFLEGVKRR